MVLTLTVDCSSRHHEAGQGGTQLVWVCCLSPLSQLLLGLLRLRLPPLPLPVLLLQRAVRDGPGLLQGALYPRPGRSQAELPSSSLYFNRGLFVSANKF